MCVSIVETQKQNEEGDLTNKEEVEHDKEQEEEGATRARQMQHVCFLFRFVIRRRRGKTAFGFLHSLSRFLYLALTSCASSGGPPFR